MLLMLCAIGIGAYLSARHEAEEIFSARLANSARVLEALVAHQLEKATITAVIEIPLPRELNLKDDTLTDLGHSYEYKISFQIWSNDGRLLAKSASAPTSPLAALSPGYSEIEVNTDLWRAFCLKSGSVWVLTAEKDEVRREIVDELGVSILIPMVIGGALLILSVNLVVSSTLTPIQKLARGIAKREPDSLAPFVTSDIPEELLSVVKELNSLLQRVQQAFDREKRFIDAAAHEIRTPIAAVQLHVQNAVHARNEQEREGSLAEALVGLKRTTQLAEQLLTFSRLTSDTDLTLRGDVSLLRICREEIELQEPLLDRKNQTIGLEADQDCKIAGDPYRLKQLVRNLIDNASEHGLPEGDINVALSCNEHEVLLQISNDGVPVPVEEADLIFTPYYRISPRSGPGAGLGLSIVKEIARQHDAKISIARKADNQGCVVTVAFPRVYLKVEVPIDPIRV